MVAGWCLQYLLASVVGHVNGDADYVLTISRTSRPIRGNPLCGRVGFIVLTHLVVARGVRNGIERASKLLMPTLLVLLVGLDRGVMHVAGSNQGHLEFLFKPDFSKIDRTVVLEALGQAFFSLSLGTACLCTYASYFSRQTNLMRSAVQIALARHVRGDARRTDDFPRGFLRGGEPRLRDRRSSSSPCPMCFMRLLAACRWWVMSSPSCSMRCCPGRPYLHHLHA